MESGLCGRNTFSLHIITVCHRVGSLGPLLLPLLNTITRLCSKYRLLSPPRTIRLAHHGPTDGRSLGLQRSASGQAGGLGDGDSLLGRGAGGAGENGGQSVGGDCGSFEAIVDGLLLAQ